MGGTHRVAHIGMHQSVWRRGNYYVCVCGCGSGANADAASGAGRPRSKTTKYTPPNALLPILSYLGISVCASWWHMWMISPLAKVVLQWCVNAAAALTAASTQHAFQPALPNSTLALLLCPRGGAPPQPSNPTR